MRNIFYEKFGSLFCDEKNSERAFEYQVYSEMMSMKMCRTEKTKKNLIQSLIKKLDYSKI